MGFVYILVNKGMPGLVKIGYTNGTAEERAKELSRSTGVPYPFEVAYALYCKWYIKLEKDIHRKLVDYRLPNKEFFIYPVNDAIMELKQLHLSYLDIKIPPLESRKTKLIEGIEKAKKAEQALLARGHAARQETEFLESEVAQLEAEVTKAHQQIEVLKSKTESQRIETESLRREIPPLESRKTKLIEGIKKAEQEEQALFARKRSTRREIESLGREIESLESEVERLKAKENRLSKEVEDLECLKAEVDNLEKEKRELMKFKNAVGQKVRILPQKNNTKLKDKSVHLRSKKGKDPGYKNAVGRREKFTPVKTAQH